jgi:glycosyltransferase involved in cell wall biosynthesis
MKALVLATSYPVRPGSVSGAFVREMLRGLVARGFGFEVVTPAAAAPGAGAPEPGIVVREAPYCGDRLRGGLAHARGIPETLAAEPWKWALAPGLAHALARVADRRLAGGGFDLVWSHWLFPCGAIGARLARRHRIPHLATAHGADVCWLERLARLPGARAALAALWSGSALTAPAARTAQRVGAVLGRADVGVAALPASVAAGEPSGGTPRLLYLGRFEPIKGPDLLLDAMAMLPAGLFGDLTLAGAGSLEGALRARSARLATPVRFPGVVEGVRKDAALAASHAVVLPSRRMRDGRIEGLPHAAFEALAAGRPVIAPREGALADLVADSGAGVLYDAPADDAGRTRALAAALLALGRRPHGLSALSARARAAGAAFRAPRALEPWREQLERCAGGCA